MRIYKQNDGKEKERLTHQEENRIQGVWNYQRDQRFCCERHRIVQGA